ncbi:MAG: hypothetical protein AB1552_00685 [Nitrospirota bacterium]
MIILDEFEGKTISLDLYDGELSHVLSLLADAARQDGFFLVVDKQIKGKIQVQMDEPWNIILIEILAGVNFMTMLVNNKILISLMDGIQEEPAEQ